MDTKNPQLRNLIEDIDYARATLITHKNNLARTVGGDGATRTILRHAESVQEWQARLDGIAAAMHRYMKIEARVLAALDALIEGEFDDFLADGPTIPQIALHLAKEVVA